MFLESVLCPVVLLRLFRLSRIGSLHTGSSEVEQAEADDRWNNLLCRRRVVYRMEFLVEGRAGSADGDTDDGMVVGVLHPQRIAGHLRRLPAVQLHPEGSQMD